MENKQHSKKYKSNNSLLITIVFTIAGLLFFGYIGGTLEKIDETLVIIICSMCLLFWIAQKRLYIDIVENRMLVNSGQDLFKKHKLDIFDIEYMERAPVFNWNRSWGSMLVFYYKENQEWRYTSIREVNYSIEVLKELIQDIIRLNPSIKICSDYKKLIEGVYDNMGDGFKKIKTEESLRNIEKRIGIKK